MHWIKSTYDCCVHCCLCLSAGLRSVLWCKCVLRLSFVFHHDVACGALTITFVKHISELSVTGFWKLWQIFSKKNNKNKNLWRVTEIAKTWKFVGIIWIWTSFSCITSLAGCKLHSSACQFQPKPVGRLFVQSGWTEVRHGSPAGYSTTTGEHPVVSGS